MTSSPGWISKRMAAISRASVQDVVSKTFLKPNRCSKNSLHFFVYRPSPEIFPLFTARVMYSVSFPVKWGLLNGIIHLVFVPLLYTSKSICRTYQTGEELLQFFEVSKQRV